MDYMGILTVYAKLWTIRLYQAARRVGARDGECTHRHPTLTIRAVPRRV